MSPPETDFKAIVVERTCCCLQVLLHAGPEGLTGTNIAERAQSLSLVASDWVTLENKDIRSSQISNIVRTMDIFVHVGRHRYALAALSGVTAVPVRPTSGM